MSFSRGTHKCWYANSNTFHPAQPLRDISRFESMCLVGTKMTKSGRNRWMIKTGLQMSHEWVKLKFHHHLSKLASLGTVKWLRMTKQRFSVQLLTSCRSLELRNYEVPGPGFKRMRQPCLSFKRLGHWEPQIRRGESRFAAPTWFANKILMSVSLSLQSGKTNSRSSSSAESRTTIQIAISMKCCFVERLRQYTFFFL